jgi:hypothetical protein
MSRALRYPLNLEQVVCTHKRLGRMLDRFTATEAGSDARIVIHGDHGSRLDLGPPWAALAGRLSPRDFVDAYSTLFAVRDASVEAGYDRRSIPLDTLFTSLMRDGGIPDGIEWVEGRDVYLRANGMARMSARPMPEFSNGTVARR